MDAQQALNLLRTNPEAAFQECAYFINPYATQQYGGTCTVRIEPLENAISENMFSITLSADANGTDYFFPTPQVTNIGECEVPKNLPKGTLAFSGGMNGCSLQVNDLPANNRLLFMHCVNGAPGHPGTSLCRVDYKHYAGPPSNANGYILGSSYLTLTREISHCYYAYFPIVIKTEPTKWHVYMNGIVHDKQRKYTKIPGTYMLNNYCISSFDE